MQSACDNVPHVCKRHWNDATVLLSRSIGVLAYLRLAAIAVENAHSVLGSAPLLRWKKENDPIPANSKVAVAHADGLVRGQKRFPLLSVVDLSWHQERMRKEKSGKLAP